MMNFAATIKKMSRDCSITLFFAKVGCHAAILQQCQTGLYEYYGAGSGAFCSCRRIATLNTDRRLREVTSLRKAFSPAASRTAQKLHPAEKLLPLPRSISASSQAQPSGLAIALKAFCKKEAAWPESAHYRTTPTARSQNPSCSSKTACSQSRRCAYTPPRPLLPHC